MTLFQNWAEAVQVSFQNLVAQFSSIILPLIGAIVIFTFGWIIAAAFGSVTERILKKAMQVDKIFNQLGFMKVMHKAGLEWEFSGFVGLLVKWFLLLVFFLAGVEVLQLHAVATFLREEVLTFIPKVVVAALIVLIAAMAADFVDKMVKSSAQAAELRFPKIGSVIIRWSIWVFAFLVAAEQLGVESDFLDILFTGVIAFLAIAGGLAFGFGGQGVAREWLEKFSKGISEDK